MNHFHANHILMTRHWLANQTISNAIHLDYTLKLYIETIHCKYIYRLSTRQSSRLPYKIIFVFEVISSSCDPKCFQPYLGDSLCDRLLQFKFESVSESGHIQLSFANRTDLHNREPFSRTIRIRADHQSWLRKWNVKVNVRTIIL